MKNSKQNIDWIKEPTWKERGQKGDGNWTIKNDTLVYGKDKVLARHLFDEKTGDIKGPFKLVDNIPVDSKGNDITDLLDWTPDIFSHNYPNVVIQKHPEHFHVAIQKKIKDAEKARSEKSKKFWKNVLFGTAGFYAYGAVKGRFTMYDKDGKLKNHYVNFNK
jgi:hypothetical protein